MKTNLMCNNESIEPRFINTDSFCVGMASIKNPESLNSLNEDSLGSIELTDGRLIVFVADGAGGFPKGEDASSKVCELLSEEVKDNLSGNPDLVLRTVILDSIEKANKLLMEKGNGARTTLLVCEVEKDRIRSYQIGDCELFVCGQKGKEKFRITVHSPVGYAIEAGVLDKHEALDHPERHMISNLLGEIETKVEIGPWVDLAMNDTIFLGSDGIFDNIKFDDLIELVRLGSVEESTENIINQVSDTKNYIKADDTSFLILKRK